MVGEGGPGRQRGGRPGGWCGCRTGMSGAGEKTRTSDLRITNALLYQLSYTGGSREAFTDDSGEAFDCTSATASRKPSATWG